MKSLAIVGAGVAGMACGYHLHKSHAVTVYEKNDYAGGHANTVYALDQERAIPIDTGFMVYNEVTYPNLTRLFAELGVRTQPTAMSFSVQHVPSGIEYCGSGLNGLFAQRRNLGRPRFWRLLWNIRRFNKRAPDILSDAAYAGMTLRDYAVREGYHPDLLEYYLIPMSSAVWSTPPATMLDFPAVTLVRFFQNHGFLGLNTQHPWRTIAGGSGQYRDKLIASFRDNIFLSRAASAVERREGKAWVTDASGQTHGFDRVILACHADQALGLLKDATDDERRLLSPFHYQKNVALLHSDETVMPRTRACWSSWNYRQDGRKASTIYWMNRLEGLSDCRNFFVSINDPGAVAAAKSIREIVYHHPIFSVEATAAQGELPKLNKPGPVYFCGSYFRYGFHEDALASALDVVEKLRKDVS